MDAVQEIKNGVGQSGAVTDPDSIIKMTLEDKITRPIDGGWQNLVHPPSSETSFGFACEPVAQW